MVKTRPQTTLATYCGGATESVVECGCGSSQHWGGVVCPCWCGGGVVWWQGWAGGGGGGGWWSCCCCCRCCTCWWRRCGRCPPGCTADTRILNERFQFCKEFSEQSWSRIHERTISLRLYSRYTDPKRKISYLQGVHRTILKPNSRTYNFVEVSVHNLASFQTWGFCMDFLHHREGGMVFYQISSFTVL